MPSLHPNTSLIKKTVGYGLKCLCVFESNGSGVGVRCRVPVNNGCIDLSAFEYLSRPQRWMLLSFFPLLYVEASNLSVYCIVKAMECTVHTNRVNSFVLQHGHVQNDCNIFVSDNLSLVAMVKV